MHRRGFVGAALACVGGLFFPQKVKADADIDSIELDGCLIERITPHKVKWGRDMNGKVWISEESIGSWMITGETDTGGIHQMYGCGIYVYKTPEEALDAFKEESNRSFFKDYFAAARKRDADNR